MQSGFEPTSFNFHRQDEKVWQHDWVRFLKWLRMSCSYSTFHFERSKQQLKRRRRDKQEERRVGHENKWPHGKTETEANSAESSIGDKHKEEKGETGENAQHCLPSGIHVQFTVQDTKRASGLVDIRDQTNRIHTSPFISLQSSSISSALSSSDTSPSSAFSSMLGGSFFPWWTKEPKRVSLQFT